MAPCTKPKTLKGLPDLQIASEMTAASGTVYQRSMKATKTSFSVIVSTLIRDRLTEFPVDLVALA